MLMHAGNDLFANDCSIITSAVCNQAFANDTSILQWLTDNGCDSTIAKQQALISCLKAYRYRTSESDQVVTKVFVFLLDHLDVNEKCPEGKPLILYVILFGRFQEEFMQLFIDRGVDFNLKDKRDVDAFMHLENYIEIHGPLLSFW